MREIVLAALLSAAVSAPLQAQDMNTKIGLELNRAEDTSDGNCQVVFLGSNGLDQDFEEVSWRLALFDSEGIFSTLLSLPLGSLSAGKRRIVQYNLPFACDNLSEIIVNDVAQCTIKGAAESDICLTALDVSSRTDIAFGL